MIKGALRRDETTLRLGGNGDNFHMSWRADDSLIVAVCDGAGLPGTSQGSFNSRLFRIDGAPPEVRFGDVPGYPVLGPHTNPEEKAAYYGFGTIALDDRIYQFLSTLDSDPVAHRSWWTGAKLIYSPDGGKTWCNSDGTTPVVWQPENERSKDTLVFFDEPQDAFSLTTILQMGRNYEHNTDGYVYVYGTNGTTDGTMNELVLFRVPKDRIMQRSAYEFFVARRGDGEAEWAPDIDSRGVVHTFPRGWVNEGFLPHAWHGSVVYNAALGVYMMASFGNGTSPDGKIGWVKPSYLGFWSAPNPWGPWTQFHEETSWTPNDDPGARTYEPQIAPKWISADGSSFWMVWSDFQNTIGRYDTGVFQQPGFKLLHYEFNVQRVDLVLADTR